MQLIGLPVLLSMSCDLGSCNDLSQMRMGRLELPRHCCHRYLKPARLPIPPHPRGCPLAATNEHYNTASWTPDRVLPVTNDSLQWYEGTPDLPSHPVSDPETHWYDWNLAYAVVSGSAK